MSTVTWRFTPSKIEKYYEKNCERAFLMAGIFGTEERTRWGLKFTLLTRGYCND